MNVPSFLPRFTFLLLLALAACRGESPQSYDIAAEQSDAARSSADEAAPVSAPAPPNFAPDTSPPADLARELDPFSTRVALFGAVDSLKKFVRTAEVRGRVRDVLHSTLAIEDVVARNGGFVLDNHLSTQVELREREPVSRDSAIEVTRYSVHNELTLRVPVARLDTTLRSIGRHVEFLDYRIVKADDITFRLLEEQLAQRRLADHRQHLRAALQSKQERDGMGENAERLLASRTEADARRLERLRLDDAVAYSTVKVTLYQPSEVRYAQVAKTDLAPRAPLGYRLGQSLAEGWVLLEMLLLAIVRLWGVGVVAALAYWLYRRLAPRLRRRVRTPVSS